ncbi:MAG: 30S ribosomal protein S20 [Patescibacteria group bacterium]
MPISRSAKKSWRKSVKNRKVNVSFRNKVKSEVKKYLLKPSEAGLKEVFSVLDKSQKKRIYHRNKVARLKSRMAKRLNPSPLGKLGASPLDPTSPAASTGQRKGEVQKATRKVAAKKKTTKKVK